MTINPELLFKLVKARLLPLSPLDSALEWLIERMPRRLIRVNLIPNDHIAVINEPNGEYKATSSTPSFEIIFTASSPQSGWYYLEGALVRNNGSRDARILAEIRGKDNEFITIPIPSNLRGTVREVLYLPPDVMTLHWLPTAATGFFSQSELLIHKITTLESTCRRLHRVIFDLWRFRRLTPTSRLGLTLTSIFSDLQGAYECSARFRIERLYKYNFAALIDQNETLNVSCIRRINRRINKFSQRPLLTIIIPLLKADAYLLKLSIASLEDQLYQNWELVIACSIESSDLQTSHLLAHTSSDARIKIVFLKTKYEQVIESTNLLNHALKVTCGEWVMRLDMGDRLPRDALFHVVAEHNQYPEAQFIYGDDDNIDIAGKRTDLRFKPDWNPDLLTSHDYIGHPAIYRSGRLVELGGYAGGFAGAEDYELSLRYLQGIQEVHIRHVHKILYHCDATSFRMIDLHSLHDAGRRALERHYSGTNIKVDDGASQLLYHIRRPIPSPPPLVSIIIPTRDKVDLLRVCVSSIQKKTDYHSWELLIVDNGSIEQDTLTYFQELESDTRIKILHYHAPFNYSAINNFAVNHTEGEILLLLNNDVEVIASDWLTEMVSHAVRPEIGAVGAKLLYPDDTVQHAGVILGIGGIAAHVYRFQARDAPGYCYRAVVTQNLSAVTGACLAVRKPLYKQIGGLDEEHLHVAFNDIDFCLKLLEAGYKNVFTPYALLYHHESISRGMDDTPEKKAIYDREFCYMKRIWGEILTSDKAYNSNLSLNI